MNVEGFVHAALIHWANKNGRVQIAKSGSVMELVVDQETVGVVRAFHAPMDDLESGWLNLYLAEQERAQEAGEALLMLADQMRMHEGEAPGMPYSLHRLAKVADARAADAGVHRS